MIFGGVVNGEIIALKTNQLVRYLDRVRASTLKGVALLGVLFLLVAIMIVIAVPPANQYEISIYRVYPHSFWVSVVGAMIVGSLLIITSVRTSASRWWVFGFLLMLGTNALLLLLPFIRGYYMLGRADGLSHLGYVQDIASYGDLGGNIYPPMHLLVLVVADATGSDPRIIAMVIPVIFSGIYFGAMFYLVVHLVDSRERILFVLPFVMLPILRQSHVGFRPIDLAVMILPLVLYVFVKGQRNPSVPIRSTFVIILFALIVYHPLTALFLIGVFLLYIMARWAPQVRKQYATPTNLVSLSGVLFVGWYSSSTAIILRFNRIYTTLFGSQGGESPAEGYTQAAAEASPALVDLIRVVTFKYGIELVLFSLGFLFFVLGIFLFLHKRYVPTTYTIMFVGMVGLFGGGGLTFLFADLIVPPDRSFQFAKIGAVLITGQLFYLLWDRVDWNRRQPSIQIGVRIFFVAIIILLIVLSTFSLYESPLASEKNHQVTEMEVDGTEWLVAHGHASSDLLEFGMSYRRFFEAEHGLRASKPFNANAPPDHFNYDEQKYLGQSYINDRYLTLTRHGRIVYPEAFPNYPENWRFTPSDFDRLERDRTISRIYDNGGYTQYMVRANQEPPAV